MEKKNHYKLYKSGKKWCCALIATATVALAVGGSQLAAHADEAVNNTYQVQQVIQPTEQQVSQASQTAHQPVEGDATTNAAWLDGYQLTVNQKIGQVSLQANGWQVAGTSNDQQYRYAILFDNTTNSEINRQQITGQIRPDVEEVYQDIPNSGHSGFNVKFDLPENITGHTVSIVARYSDQLNGEGNNTDFWFAPIIITDVNAASLDGISNDQAGNLRVSGWHATNQAWGYKYHYIIAYDSSQGREIGRQQTTCVERQDVAKAYPGIANADISGFDVQFKLAPEYSRGQIQFISRWTDDPAGNGNYVDYWFSPVNKINRGYLDDWSISNHRLNVSGWHANDAAIYQPYHHLILLDNTLGRQVATALVPTIQSDDVAQIFTDTRSASRARFNYQFGQDTQLQAGHEYVLVSRYSVSDLGNGDTGNSLDFTDFWYSPFKLDQSAYWIEYYQIDDSNLLHVIGWFANDLSVGKPYAYVIALTNGGKELARKRVDLTPRYDVTAIKLKVAQTQQTGFNTTIQLPHDQREGDLQFVLRFSDDPETGEGSRTDIWTQPIANGLMKNRLVINERGYFYYDNTGKLADSFLVNGILYHTDGQGTLMNKFPDDQLSIGKIAIKGDFMGIGRNDSKPVNVVIDLKNGKEINAWATVKWQGDSSLTWPKKGYRLKLFKDAEMTEKLKLKLPGSGFKTNSFNLKACFTDPTAGLNVVNAQLFSEITATRPGIKDSLVGEMPNYGQIVGVPVELGVNDLDQGLYVLETYQEDKLYGLDDKKVDNIALSDKQSSLSHFDQQFTSENLQDAEFEARSPKKVDQSVADRFNELYRLANTSDDEYSALENQYLDVSAAIDYLVFSTAIDNIDGVTKNATYISKEGNKWVIMPYDLDASWNSSWDGTKLDIENNFEQLISKLGNKLMLQVYRHHRLDIVNRYNELRQTVLSTEHVQELFSQWFDQIGSANYENNEKLWSSFSDHQLNFNSEEFLQAVQHRLETVDGQLG